MTHSANNSKQYERINENLLASFSVGWRLGGLGEQTLAEYIRHLRVFARRLDGSLLDANREDLDGHVTTELKRLSPASAAYATRALKRFYGWLTLEGEIESNPALRLKTPKVPEPVVKIADAEDVRKMMSMCRTGMFAKFNHRRDLALIHVLRSAGLRIGEAARVELQHIDVATPAIIVP